MMLFYILPAVFVLADAGAGALRRRLDNGVGITPALG
jgi:hypothetical protein